MPPLTSKPLFNIIVMLLVSILIVGLLHFKTNQYSLEKKISEYLTPYLFATLDESMFSKEPNVVNDINSITSIGQKINRVLAAIVTEKWYSGIRACTVTIHKIDGELISPAQPSAQKLIITMARNQITRSVELGINYQHQSYTYIFWLILITAVFFIIYRLVPYPLTSGQLEWNNYLVKNGYDEKTANKLCHDPALDNLELNDIQQHTFDLIHIQEQQNFQFVIKSIQDPRVAKLDEQQAKWFLSALKKNSGDLESALTLALSTNIIEINLTLGTLKIHGIDITMHKTPLLYYAWYANKKLTDSGWMINPQSNKPDRKSGDALAEFMTKYAGHGRAIADLEDFGLKAKTLDQNRSKIKDEIISVLGDTLAPPYLFETQKDTVSKRMSYQLKISSDRIRILG